METKVITAHLPIELAERVDQMADSLERSRGWIVKEALVAWVSQEEERHRWTVEALADVDGGRVIDDPALQAWVDNLDVETPFPPTPDRPKTRPARRKR
ncbi:MAG: ribbon-helix-helix domain-containing protein [Gemmatimonadaceae bacterium]